jgi:hypothetical protein
MNISIFFNTLAQNPWITLLTITIALIGVILTIIFYLKGRRKKSIRYSIKSDCLFEDFVEKITGLSIQFSKKQIKTLTVTKIAFWNDGTETINCDDFPSNDTFSISIDNNYDILDVSVIHSNKDTNNIKINLSKDRKKIDLEFEYLDHDDGFVIQIFHTNIDYPNKFNINGYIKSFGKLSNGEVNNKTKLPIFLLLIYSLSFYAIIGISIWLLIKTDSNVILKNAVISLLVLIGTFSLIFYAVPNSKIPFEFRKYFYKTYRKRDFFSLTTIFEKIYMLINR